MSNWKIGQKLVSLRGGMYAPEYEPNKDQIVTFDGVGVYGGIFLKEYSSKPPFLISRAEFRSTDFRPLQGEPAKAELLSSFREVVESPDCPINVPQT